MSDEFDKFFKRIMKMMEEDFKEYREFFRMIDELIAKEMESLNTSFIIPSYPLKSVDEGLRGYKPEKEVKSNRLIDVFKYRSGVVVTMNVKDISAKLGRKPKVSYKGNSLVVEKVEPIDLSDYLLDFERMSVMYNELTGTLQIKIPYRSDLSKGKLGKKVKIKVE